LQNAIVLRSLFGAGCMGFRSGDLFVEKKEKKKAL
jgi:hypothetical protein